METTCFGANRATLLVFVGAGSPGEMALAVILAMTLGRHSAGLCHPSTGLRESPGAPDVAQRRLRIPRRAARAHGPRRAGGRLRTLGRVHV
ncbi:unnamed protein product, partial [Durusdinium trenchii]